MLSTIEYLQQTDFPAIQRTKLEILQLNLGYLCNQQCLHCHVDASPRRKEIMTREDVDVVLMFVEKHDIKILDLTGGAPEMNPSFRYLVTTARAMGVKIIDRCNLTILEEPGYETLATFLAENDVEVVASMPCYLQENVDSQRGQGVFSKSILGLKRLNALGYGGSGRLKLNLVYNPQGATLPPDQNVLEITYKKELKKLYDIEFDQLFTITNMPIKRFGSTLLSKGIFHQYMDLLKESYQESNLDSLMCKTLISVDWQGNVYDCDFNQMLGLRSNFGGGKSNLRDLMKFDFKDGEIMVMDHCFGCTAGKGSSCGGVLT